MPLSHTEKVDAANIALMIIACAIAFVLPFELFLLSYAVLGPLHYLTEIGWLHNKGYYTNGKNDFVFLGILGLIITLGALGFLHWSETLTAHLVYLAFLSGLVMVTIKDKGLKTAAIVLIAISSFFFRESTFYIAVFTVFIPTILHVFVFTALFMLFGVLKSRSRLGLLSILVLIACTCSFFFANTPYWVLSSKEYLAKSMGGFLELNRQLINLFGLADLEKFSQFTFRQNAEVILGSGAGITVMRFIAFAYTYHYLNWFSKTSVIQWHKVPRKTLISVGLVWLVSVSLYAYKYEVGLKWLFLLSFLHVLLEFPLNYRSFIGIGQEFTRLAKTSFK